ncbi:hypothetical protein, partial [Enterococcus faecalis]|uniref:hypothetical protein n=1 Tax=Enterococcus faecalis TaxID=1351 RepID=UPI00232CA61F
PSSNRIIINNIQNATYNGLKSALLSSDKNSFLTSASINILITEVTDTRMLSNPNGNIVAFINFLCALVVFLISFFLFSKEKRNRHFPKI